MDLTTLFHVGMDRPCAAKYTLRASNKERITLNAHGGTSCPQSLLSFAPTRCSHNAWTRLCVALPQPRCRTHRVIRSLRSAPLARLSWITLGCAKSRRPMTHTVPVKTSADGARTSCLTRPCPTPCSLTVCAMLTAKRWDLSPHPRATAWPVTAATCSASWHGVTPHLSRALLWRFGQVTKTRVGQA